MAQPINISPQQLQSMNKSPVVIDVRTGLEYVMGHIPGSRRLSPIQILKQVPQDQPVVVTCLSGHRSQPVADWMVEQGYQQVYQLQGGLLMWLRARLPVHRGIRP